MRHCRRHTAYAALISIFSTLTPAIKAQESDSVMYAKETLAAAALGESLMPPLTLEQLTVPPSPEAWAMSRHTDETVDLATGTGRLDIPLFSWQAGDLTMSMSLSCRLGAFRAREAGGWIGLGWTLNGGGCVTRTIMGLPDEQGPLDIKASSWIGSTSHSEESLQYIKDIEDMRVDAMADRYSYSCPGASGEFLVIGGEIIQTPVSDNTIEFTGTERDGVRDFLVTTPDGTRYYFTEREHVSYRFIASTLSTPYHTPDYTGAVSAWHLTKIVAPGGETVTFGYSTVPSWTRSTSSYSVSYTLTWKFKDIVTLTTPEHRKFPARSVTYFDDQKVLSSITSRTAVVTLTTSPRTGVEDTPVLLSSIQVHTPGGGAVRDITLTHSGSSSSRLGKVETRSGSSLLSRHSFTYNESGGTYTDFFGFRSATGQQDRPVVDPATGHLNAGIVHDPGACIAGTIKSHTDANGLTTEYSYEPAYAVCMLRGGAESFPIGARLRAITATDAATGRSRIRAFTYSDGIPSIDMSRLDAGAFVSVTGTTQPDPNVINGLLYVRTVTFHSSSRTPGSSPENAVAMYPRVEETLSGTGIANGIKSVYEFDVAGCMAPFRSLTGYVPDLGRDLESRYIPLWYVLFPAATPKGVEDAVRNGDFMSGIFSETAGISPLLRKVTRMEHDGSGYRTLSTEEHFYQTADSASHLTGVAHESIAVTITDRNGYVRRDYQAASDILYGNTTLVCARHLPDSTATVTHFPDGSTRLSTTRHLYSSPNPPTVARPVTTIGKTVYLHVPDPAPFNCDSITRKTDITLHTGTRIREGGHTIEHHTAVAANITGSAFYGRIAANGQKTLPVREIWVVDGRDTITRSWEYGRYGTAYRPSRITLAANGGAELDRQTIGGYTSYGHPTSVTSPGKPTVSYEWGQGGDLMTAMTVGSGTLAQKSTFTYLPLVGCTSVTSPDGSTVRYTYDGARLVSATNPDGTVIQKYEYALAGETADGLTRVRTRSRLNDSGTGTGSWSAVSTIYDGFGLPIMELKEGFGSGKENVGTVTCYDALHRPVRQWRPLPVDSEADVLYNDNGLTQAAMSLYNDGTAYTAMTYPGYATDQWSSLALPGSDFAQHPTMGTRGCSSTSSADFKVIRYSFDGTTLRSEGYYSNGELDCRVETTPDGYRTMTFTDALGHVVLTRRDADGGKFADTYTVSDSWGNPLIALSPEASAQLTSTNSSWDISTDAIDKLAFIYTYDSRLRLRSVKIPGCGSTRYAYDREGRLAYTRDARQAEDGIRTFHLYDALGRETVTGICNDSNPDIWTTDLSSTTTSMQASRVTKAGQGLAGSGYMASSSVASYPELLTAFYYDDYNFLPSGWTSAESDTPSRTLQTPKGYSTGTLTALLGETDSSPLLTVTTYRKGGIPVRTESECLGGGRNIVTTESSAAGLPLEVKDNLRMPDQNLMSVNSSYKYDGFGRMSSLSINSLKIPDISMPRESKYTLGYDVAGNLVQEEILNLRHTLSLDIRGNLTESKFTRIFLHEDRFAPLLSENIYYGDGGKNPEWTGRVVARQTECGSSLKRYDYSYSPQGFLLNADYTGSSDTQDYSESYAYDLNANIKKIERYGLLENGKWGWIFNSSITRSGNLPKDIRIIPPRPVALETRTASSTRPVQPTSFTFDVNGCLTEDNTRGIDRITYNALNLPERIEFSSGDTIHYVYMSDGRKILERYVSADGLSDRERAFVGSWVFVDGVFDRFETQQEYIGSDGMHYFYAKDFQGNILEVLNISTSIPYLEQHTEYYAYGLPHGDANYAEKNRRKFGGKEYMTEFGLDEYDYVARRYDPLLGHFTTPDPLASGNPSISPWAYCNGDPINFIDPTGLIVIYNKQGDYLGHSSEGFTGEVYIYTGEEEIDRNNLITMSATEIIDKYKFDMLSFDIMSVSCTETFSGNAISNIWTNIISHFEGLEVCGEKFSLSSIPKGVIGYSKPNSDKTKNAAWITWRNSKGQVTGIDGTANLDYETTVENVASSVIVHEWYSHVKMGIDDDFKNHRFAYINVIDYEALWTYTTANYKRTMLNKLLHYTKLETGNDTLDKKYQKLYEAYF